MTGNRIDECGHHYDKNKNYIGYIYSDGKWLANESDTNLIHTGRTPDNAYYVRFELDFDDHETAKKVVEGQYLYMLQEGSIATNYEPYVEPVTTNIYLNEPLIKIGEYSNYIDFNMGHIKKNVDKVDLGTIVWRYDEINSYFYTSALKNKVTGATNILSTHYPVIYQALEKGDKFIRGSTSNYIVQIKDLDYEDITTFKEAMNGRMMYYQLTSPIEQTIQLPKINNYMGATQINIDTKVKPTNMEFIVVKKLKQL